jgi:DNA-binding XRE family transcriptional regulator
VLESVGALLRAWRLQQGLTQGEVARLLHATTKAVSNWETGSRRISLDAVVRLDRAYEAGGCLVDLVRATGKAEASARSGGVRFLEPRRAWSHVFDEAGSPVWLWIRPASGRSGPLRGTVFSGPLGVELPAEVGAGGLFLTLAHWHSRWPFHVVLDQPGWVEYGCGVPPAWLRDEAETRTFLSSAEFVHAPDQQVEFLARKVRERDHGDPDTLVERLRALAGPANWDLVAASWLRGAASPGRLHREPVEQDAVPPATQQERCEAHRVLRAALGMSRADAADAATELLGPGERPVTEHQIYHYEAGRISRVRQLPALLDRVYRGDGWTCLEAASVRRVAADRVIAEIPPFWIGPVRVTAEPTGAGAEPGEISFLMGSWQNRRLLAAAGTNAFRFSRTPGSPDVQVSVPAGWRIAVHLGLDPAAVVVSNDWTPAEDRDDEVFDASVESLMRTVGRTRADLDAILAPTS